MPKEEIDMPGTLERSPKKAQDTYADTLDNAEEQSKGDEARAHQTAWASVKHNFEKVGDHWEPKDESGPSDDRAAEGAGPRAPTAGGVDANATKKHLYDVATRLEISGRSRMTKDELVAAVQRENDARTRAARG